MPFDGLVLAAVHAELSECLVGARIERIQQPSAYSIVITVHHRLRQRLLVSAHPEEARVHFTTYPWASPARLPVFAAVLRKYLEGGRVVSVRQPGLERIIQLEVTGRDELGQPARTFLIGEFMGKHSNILLVDPGSEMILDGIRRYTHAVSRYRQVLPGAPYLPPRRTKRNPLELNEDGLANELLALPLETHVARAMQSRLEGLSFVTAREIVHMAGLAGVCTVGECGVYEFARLWTVLSSLLSQAGNGTLSPCLVVDHAGDPLDFAAVPLTHCDHDTQLQSDLMNTILDHVYTHRMGRRILNGQRHALKAIVDRERRRAEKRLGYCRQTLASGDQIETLRRWGELLTANIHAISQKASEITLNDLYTGEPLTIPLNPRLGPAANAQAYFRRVQKQKTAIARANQEEARLAAEQDYLTGVEMALKQAENKSDLEDIREELVGQGYIPAPTLKKKRASTKRISPQPLSFCAPDGTPILVGKNNRQNDYVTFRIACDEDLWLHARGMPGAHVVIRAGSRAVSPEVLETAASLAAYYSRGRDAGSVPVDYTLRRHVKKPRGSRPGFVIYREENTVMATPIRPSS